MKGKLKATPKGNADPKAKGDPKKTKPTKQPTADPKGKAKGKSKAEAGAPKKPTAAEKRESNRLANVAIATAIALVCHIYASTCRQLTQPP